MGERIVEEWTRGIQEGTERVNQLRREECPVYASLIDWEPVEWDEKGITLPWCERFGCDSLCRFRKRALERLADMTNNVTRVDVIGSNRDAAGNDLDDA